MKKVWQWCSDHSHTSGAFFVALSIALGAVCVGLSDSNAKQPQDEIMNAMLAKADMGDMIVVYNSARTKGCVLIIERQMLNFSPPQMTATFPLGNCVETASGTVVHTEVVKIAGDDGVLLVIPQRNVATALRSMLNMAGNFQY